MALRKLPSQHKAPRRQGLDSRKHPPLHLDNDRAQMRKILQHAWQTRGLLACFLWPISRIYGVLVRTRRHLYKTGFFKSEKLPIPVLVVGNVVAGGAGKTPLVIALVQHYHQRGLKVGVLSRGYGRERSACQEVFANTPVSESGDEPALLKRATGAAVFVGSSRIEAAHALLQAHPAVQLLICDDGLQHYALRRDVEIVVFDDGGVGNGWLLPAGPLREAWPDRMHGGIDLVLHTGQKPAFKGFAASRRLSDHAIAADGNAFSLHSLRGQKVIALAAIANPGAFFDMLMACGLTLNQTISLPDHYDFSDYHPAFDPQTTLLCTEKDSVKLFGLPSMAGIRVLAVRLLFSPEPDFLAAVDALLSPLIGAPTFSPVPSRHGH